MTNFLRKLKCLRVAVALIIFCAITAQFLDLYHALPKPYFMWNPTGTQFAPSLLEMLATGSIAAGAAFLTFSIFAVVFGRAYCSFFCPLGIFMDIVRRIFKPKARNKMKYMRGLTALRALSLFSAICLIAFGYSALFGFIDPYSLYGKIAGIFRVGLACAVNGTAEALSHADIYAVSPIGGSPYIAFPAFGAALLILIVVSLASAWRGRIWCNSVCPVGAFLGGISKFSLFKLSLDQSKCIACGMCEKTCKAQCISAKEGRLDFNRCVLCFDCAYACRKNAITITPFWEQRRADTDGNLFDAENTLRLKKSTTQKNAKEENKTNASQLSESRREFPKLALTLFGILAATAKRDLRAECASGKGDCNAPKDNTSPYQNPKNPRKDARLCVPAGAKSVENFLEKCTGCQACVAACKGAVLKPSVSEWGSLSHFMQPFMDYTKGFCLDTCHSCTKVCPTGAIEFKTRQQKMKIKIGTAMFKRGLCVVKTDGTDCAACAEHCPVQAIEMIPFRGKRGLYIPHVHKDVCIGCGACESVCPVSPKKAIVVKGLAVHVAAKPFDDSMRIYKNVGLPDTPKPAEKQNAENAFPF